MNDIQTAPEPLATPAVAESVRGEELPTTAPYFGIDYDAPPHAVAAATAFKAEYFGLLAHVAAHPEQERWWVAYRGGQRAAIGSDHLTLERECAIKFPDGLFQVYYIDPILQYPAEFVC